MKGYFRNLKDNKNNNNDKFNVIERTFLIPIIKNYLNFIKVDYNQESTINIKSVNIK